MLKIKNNIELKELEKFRFKKHKYDSKCVVDSKWVMERVYDEDSLGMSTQKYYLVSFPIIELSQTGCGLRIDLILRAGWEQKTLDLLYDLIEAGLVEKVGE